jgi:hypothetical protein
MQAIKPEPVTEHTAHYFLHAPAEKCMGGEKYNIEKKNGFSGEQKAP